MRAIKGQAIAIMLALSTTLFAFSFYAFAQQPKKIPHIGYLSANSPSSARGSVEGFQQGLRELGYVEGKNIVIEWRSAEGKLDRLPALVADPVRLKVDIIVTAGPSPTRVAKEATSMIPVVMTQDPDPVGSGFVASLARPGGNITGLSTLAPELSGKRLELLKENRSETPSRGRLGDFNQPRQLTNVKRDGARRKEVRSDASIPRRTRPQGH